MVHRKLAALSFAAAIVAVSACSSGATTSPAASPAASAASLCRGVDGPVRGSLAVTAAAPVTLTLWHNYGTEANAKATEALVKAYMADNPNVTIQVVSQPADNYFDLLKTAAISKTGPDLPTMWTGLFVLQNQGYLEPLNQLHPGRHAQARSTGSTGARRT